MVILFLFLIEKLFLLVAIEDVKVSEDFEEKFVEKVVNSK